MHPNCVPLLLSLEQKRLRTTFTPSDRRLSWKRLVNAASVRPLRFAQFRRYRVDFVVCFPCIPWNPRCQQICFSKLSGIQGRKPSRSTSRGWFLPRGSVFKPIRLLGNIKRAPWPTSQRDNQKCPMFHIVGGLSEICGRAGGWAGGWESGWVDG